MSPPPLRRYRAERMLSQEFLAQRARVLATVRGRLLARGANVEEGDLEACYAQAWQGLYAAMLEGQEIANPTGWLVLVTFRRAVDEHRRRLLHGAAERTPLEDDGPGRRGRSRAAAAHEPDYAARLDDRQRLRQLFEGLRGGLDAREREAASLCYLQGLSRAEAAGRMGLSEKRMRKLMEGRAPGRPGVAGKVGALVESIAAGRWCAEQASLMRALAYGVLDPDGERYRLAVLHRRECPACRAYVRSLRGLAAVLPPPLAPLVLGAGLAGGSAGHLGAHAGGAGAHAGRVAAAKGGGAGAGSGTALGGAGAGGSAAAGALSAGGGAAGAGGGWLLAGGPLGAKLAVGCLLALGIGAGCIALSAGGSSRRHRPHAIAAPASLAPAAVPGLGQRAYSAPSPHAPSPRRTLARAPRPRPPRAPALRGREFTPEQVAPQAVPAGSPPPAADTRSPSGAAASSGSSSAPTGRPAAAEREFSPG